MTRKPKRSSRAPRPSPRTVDPPRITGAESVRAVVESCFPAFAGRGVREAHRLMRQSLLENHTVFLTLSGAMTPAGLHQSAIIPLVESGAVSCLTTTGANLYHDLHRTLGFALREVNPHGDDREYRRRGVIRIYDVGFDEDVLLDTDRFFCEVLKTRPFQRSMTTPELHHELGRVVARIEDERRITHRSLLSTCFHHEVPVFVGAPQDGSIFLNVVKLAREDPRGFRFRLDAAGDVYTMAALQHRARRDGGQASIWILGGGVPKNYTLQGEPLLSQILGVEARGFDIDVQICVDVADNGALSPCTAGEGHTWGKTSIECVESRSVYLRTDVTVALPFLAAALLSDPALRREPQRLGRAMGAAVRDLDAAWMPGRRSS